MPTTAEMLRDSTMGAYAPPVDNSVTTNLPGQTGTWGDFGRALPRFPVKAALAIPDIAQSYADWRTGRAPEPAYSKQVIDGMMARGMLPERADTDMDRAGDLTADLIPANPVGSVTTGLAKLLGKAAFLPLGLMPNPPKSALDAEKLIAEGRHQEAWANSRDWKNGSLGTYQHPNGLVGIDTNDAAMTVRTGGLKDTARAMTRDGLDDPAALRMPINTRYYGVPITEVLDAPWLRDIPNIEQYRIAGAPNMGKTQGYMSPEERLIVVGADDPATTGGTLAFNKNNMRDTAGHELDHIIGLIAKEQGLYVPTLGSNTKAFLPQDLFSALTKVVGNPSPDAQRMTGFLNDLISRSGKQEGSAPYLAYQGNVAETMARMAGETAAHPTATRNQWLSMHPAERVQRLREGPMTANQMHNASSSREFVDAAERVQQGLPNALEGLFPRKWTP